MFLGREQDHLATCPDICILRLSVQFPQCFFFCLGQASNISRFWHRHLLSRSFRFYALSEKLTCFYLDGYFSRIYCFKNTNLPKSEAYYRHILSDLGIPASDALMVGDGFEKDVQAANTVGIFAVWFNPRSEETRKGELLVTVHSMGELHTFFTIWEENKC